MAGAPTELFVAAPPRTWGGTRSRFSRSAGGCSPTAAIRTFPAWPDVVQLNAFAPALRAAVIGTLRGIADQCDGVRCDMAMLVMNDVFARTWGIGSDQTRAPTIGQP